MQDANTHTPVVVISVETHAIYIYSGITIELAANKKKSFFYLKRSKYNIFF